MLRFRFVVSVLPLLLIGVLSPCQTSAPTTGEVTIRLTQGLDSAKDPAAASEGRVTKSTNPAVPVGTSVMVQVAKEGSSFTTKLLTMTLSGKAVPANSSEVVAAPDFFNKAQERLRAPGQPQDAVAGSHVFLPERMIIRMTLAEPTAAAVMASKVPSVLTPTTPSFGPVGGPAFNPSTAPNLSLPAVDALSARIKAGNGMSTVVQPGLEDGMSTFLARENLVVDGVIQPAPPGFFRGMRGIRLNPGIAVQIFDVRALDDGEHDVLHLMLTDNLLPTIGNVAFVFPKGQLATMSEAALEKVVTPFFALPILRGGARPAATAPGSPKVEQHVSSVLEGIGLGMTIEQIRAAAKLAGALRPPVKQGPVTWTVRTRDLDFQLFFTSTGLVKQYNVSALNPRKLKESRNSGPLYNKLQESFGPAAAWSKEILYDCEESCYAIVTDPVLFEQQ